MDFLYYKQADFYIIIYYLWINVIFWFKKQTTFWMGEYIFSKFSIWMNYSFNGVVVKKKFSPLTSSLRALYIFRVKQ